MWGESVGQKAEGGRGRRAKLLNWQKHLPPPPLTQPPPQPPTLCHPLLGSPSSLTATPELLIFFTPPKIVSCVPGEPTTFAVSEKQFYRRVTACRCQNDYDKIHGKSRPRYCCPWSFVIIDKLRNSFPILITGPLREDYYFTKSRDAFDATWIRR